MSPWSVGTGAPGLYGDPDPSRKRPDRCPGLGHPPTTWNPWHKQWWCGCGAHVYMGKAGDFTVGILNNERMTEYRLPDGAWPSARTTEADELDIFGDAS